MHFINRWVFNSKCSVNVLTTTIFYQLRSESFSDCNDLSTVYKLNYSVSPYYTSRTILTNVMERNTSGIIFYVTLQYCFASLNCYWIVGVPTPIVSFNSYIVGRWVSYLFFARNLRVIFNSISLSLLLIHVQLVRRRRRRCDVLFF